MPRVKTCANKKMVDLDLYTSSSSSQGQADEENPRFVDAEALSRYQQVTIKRALHHKKGFDITGDKDFGLPLEYAEGIEKLGWKKLAKHPSGFCTQMVREFYANLGVSGQTYALVRGTRVSFSAATINMRFGLKTVEDEFNPLVQRMTAAKMESLKDELAVPGTTWFTPGKIARSALKPIPKVWYHFLRHTLSPTTHTETVTKERLVMLHCILNGKKINVGEMMEAAITECAAAAKEKLVLPCLITQLCLKSGVSFQQGEALEKNKGSLNLGSINRFASYTPKPAEAKGKGKPQFQETGPSEQQDHSDELVQQVETLTKMLQQHMKQQQEFWQFSHDQHKWQKRVMEINQWKRALPLPQFPEHILSDLQQPSEVDPTPTRTTSHHDKSTSTRTDTEEWCPPPPSATNTHDRKGKKKIEESPQQDQGASSDDEQDQDQPVDQEAELSDSSEKSTTPPARSGKRKQAPASSEAATEDALSPLPSKKSKSAATSSDKGDTPSDPKTKAAASVRLRRSGREKNLSR